MKMKLFIMMMLLVGSFALNIKNQQYTWYYTPTYYTYPSSSYVYYPSSYYYWATTTSPTYYTSSYSSYYSPYTSYYYYSIPYTYFSSYYYRKDGNEKADNKAPEKAEPPQPQPGTPEQAKKELTSIKKNLFGDENKDIKAFREKAYDEKWLLKQLALTRAIQIEDYLSKKDQSPQSPTEMKPEYKKESTANAANKAAPNSITEDKKKTAESTNVPPAPAPAPQNNDKKSVDVNPSTSITTPSKKE